MPNGSMPGGGQQSTPASPPSPNSSTSPNGGTQDQNSSWRTRGTFTSLDTNGDGRISRSEASGDDSLSGNFAKADRNGDGYIDASEYGRQSSSSPSNSGPGG